MPYEGLARSCWLRPRESGPKIIKGPVGVTTSPTLLGRFGVERAELSEIAFDRKVLESF